MVVPDSISATIHYGAMAIASRPDNEKPASPVVLESIRLLKEDLGPLGRWIIVGPLVNQRQAELALLALDATRRWRDRTRE